LIASILMALQGVSWIVMGSFDPFGIYHEMLAGALFDADALTPDAVLGFRFAVGILGATDAGFFVLFAFIVRYPFANRETWAHVALSTAILAWFLLDSAFSFSIGASFNVLMVNLPCLVVLGIPLVATVAHFDWRQDSSASQ